MLYLLYHSSMLFVNPLPSRIKSVESEQPVLGDKEKDPCEYTGPSPKRSVFAATLTLLQ